MRPELLSGQAVVLRLPENEAKHIRSVLRLGAGDRVVVIDRNSGRAFEGEIEAADGGRLDVRLLAAKAGGAEGGPRIVAVLGYPKGPVADSAVEKLTELGVDRIVFFNAERTQGRISGEKLDDRMARWSRIADAAIKQSGERPSLHLDFMTDLTAVLKELNGRPPDSNIRLFCTAPKIGGNPGGTPQKSARPVTEPPENTAFFSISALLGLNGPLHLQKSAQIDEIYVLVGPEGGLSRDEIELLQSSGFKSVTLGRRTLRSETALTLVFGILTGWRSEQSYSAS